MSTKFPQKSRCAAMGRRSLWRSLLKVHPLQADNMFCFFEGDLGSAVKLEGTKCWKRTLSGKSGDLKDLPKMVYPGYGRL